MQSELIVKFSPTQEFIIPLESVPDMDAQEARSWLDQEFVRLDCEPIRSSGKVLNADKVVCIAQSAGPSGFENQEWATHFASAAKTALAKQIISIDAENTMISF